MIKHLLNLVLIPDKRFLWFRLLTQILWKAVISRHLFKISLKVCKLIMLAYEQQVAEHDVPKRKASGGDQSTKSEQNRRSFLCGTPKNAYYMVGYQPKSILSRIGNVSYWNQITNSDRCRFFGNMSRTGVAVGQISCYLPVQVSFVS